MYNIKENLLYKQPFIKDIVLEDNYTYLEAKSLLSNNKEVELYKTYSNFVYNPNKPTIIIRPLDNKVNIEVPSTYIINNMLTSYINMLLFTTKGNIEAPLVNYDNDSFTITYEITNNNNIKNINTVITAGSYTYGGKDALTFEEMKDIIIHYSTGDNQLPITIDEVKRNIENKG